MRIPNPFARSKGPTPVEATTEKPPCAHLVLTARWDNPQDIGHEDRATSFRCVECPAEFTPDEARELRSRHPLQMTG